MVTIFSLENFDLTLSVNLFPIAKLSSSTLQTIILGFMLNNPMLDKKLFSSSPVFNSSSP